MIDFIQDNRHWLFSGIGIIFLIWIVKIPQRVYKLICHYRERKTKRIDEFVENYREKYKNAGRKLEILIPAGINYFKNDKEYENGLEALAELLPGEHPLRTWKPKIKKIGYRKFFKYVQSSGKALNSTTIDGLIEEFELKV